MRYCPRKKSSEQKDACNEDSQQIAQGPPIGEAQILYRGQWRPAIELSVIAAFTQHFC
jgi:hypothetical protein